jgi:hypothetical protein
MNGSGNGKNHPLERLPLIADTRLFRWAAWCTISALAVATMGFGISLLDRTAPAAAKQRVMYKKLRIAYPLQGAIVGREIQVRGVTTYADKKHYVLVTPAGSTPSVQKGQILSSSDGSFVGSAQLGDEAVGAGESYTVTVIATDEFLLPDARPTPEKILDSDAISVMRHTQ